MGEDIKVLYLKHRPQSFDEIIGNEQIIKVLRNQVNKTTEQPLPHTILFHGPTGCGKTTLARILAKELGIKGGDLQEIDSADFRGIDTIRQIRKNSGYKPMESSARMWILDECHKMTNDAQTALLKALEDTPSHVYYVLCTTDPQKLLNTIRGRCAQYAVSPLNEREMKKLLRTVVKAEKESLSKELYEQIVLDSMGHPRNALQILAQVFSVPEKDRMKIAKRSAEIQSKTIELCRALIRGMGWKGISTILNGLKEEEPEGIRRAVLGYCQAVLLGNRPEPRAAGIMQEFIEPFYNSGFPGLVLACYSCIYEEGE